MEPAGKALACQTQFERSTTVGNRIGTCLLNYALSLFNFVCATFLAAMMTCLPYSLLTGGFQARCICCSLWGIGAICMLADWLGWESDSSRWYFMEASRRTWSGLPPRCCLYHPSHLPVFCASHVNHFSWSLDLCLDISRNFVPQENRVNSVTVWLALDNASAETGSFLLNICCWFSTPKKFALFCSSVAAFLWNICTKAWWSIFLALTVGVSQKWMQYNRIFTVMQRPISSAPWNSACKKWWVENCTIVFFVKES